MSPNPRSTISPDYLAMQRELHKNQDYGVASARYAAKVKALMEEAGSRSLSDYGAGKCRLHRALQEQGLNGYEYYPYDPAFPEYGPPKSADLVCCIDVLEHIEIDYLDAVLDELKDITSSLGLFSIAAGPAKKVLADGRNAHLIQKPSSWWLPKLADRFAIAQVEHSPRRFWVATPESFWVTVRPR